MKYKVVIGFDQSYEDTGYAVCVGGVVKSVSSISFDECSNNTEKRNTVRNKVFDMLEKLNNKGMQSNDIVIIVERIRQFSGGFISMPYIKSTAALIATIVDAAYMHGIKVYSVDTRAWKKCILGSSKSTVKLPGAKPNKELAILKAIELGFEDKISYTITSGKRKGMKMYNDNKADAICISLVPNNIDDYKKLKLESF